MYCVPHHSFPWLDYFLWPVLCVCSSHFCTSTSPGCSLFHFMMSVSVLSYLSSMIMPHSLGMKWQAENIFVYSFQIFTCSWTRRTTVGDKWISDMRDLRSSRRRFVCVPSSEYGFQFCVHWLGDFRETRYELHAILVFRNYTRTVLLYVLRIFISVTLLCSLSQPVSDGS
jgi:hypothetical protein